MLVLTRKQSETIQIGDSITITVLRMKGKAVRLGIKAPQELNVIRGELAFEQLLETSELDENVVVETTPVAAKTKSRINGPRQDDSWSTQSASVTAGLSSSAVWSI